MAASMIPTPVGRAGGSGPVQALGRCSTAKPAKANDRACSRSNCVRIRWRIDRDLTDVSIAGSVELGVAPQAGGRLSQHLRLLAPRPSRRRGASFHAPTPKQRAHANASPIERRRADDLAFANLPAIGRHDCLAEALTDELTTGLVA